MDQKQALAAIDRVFGGLPRPEPLIRNPNHCCECAEHEETLSVVTPETIGLEQVGSPAWDPVCYLSDAGYRYFMPGLARLALGTGEAYYLDQFLFHLDSGRVDVLSESEKKAVATFLDHVLETMCEEVDESMNLIELGRVMDKLAGT